MLDRVLKIAGLIPLIAAGIYLTGYISLVSYLQSYGISENVSLDFQILKGGVLLIILTGPIVFLSFADFKFGDYSNAIPAMPNTLVNNLHDAFGYTLFYSLSVAVILFKQEFDTITIILICVLITSTIINKVPLNNNLNRVVKSFYCVVVFFGIMIVTISMPITPKTSFYMMEIWAFMTCYFLRVFNKEGVVYQVSRIGTVVTATFRPPHFLVRLLSEI